MQFFFPNIFSGRIILVFSSNFIIFQEFNSISIFFFFLCLLIVDYYHNNSLGIMYCCVFWLDNWINRKFSIEFDFQNSLRICFWNKLGFFLENQKKKTFSWDFQIIIIILFYLHSLVEILLFVFVFIIISCYWWWIH